VRKRLAHSQQALAFAGPQRLTLSRAPCNDLKAGLLSFDFKLLDGRAVDHSEKAPARAGAKYQGVRTEQSQKPQLTPSPDDDAGST
jgi:hypothetical protein